MAECRVCHEEYEKNDLRPDGTCRWCAEKEAWTAFARSCGLTRFPDPSGERYVYRLDDESARKKSECIDFMDELWDALVRAKGGDRGLLLGGK